MAAAGKATSTANLPPPAGPADSWCAAVATFSITTLGCKVNQYDGQAIAAALARAGLSRAHRTHAGAVDLVVLNTCCVTAAAMRKSRQALRRAVRKSPGATVLVTGCYSNYDARRIRSLLAELGVPPARTALAGHHDDLAARIEQLARNLPPANPSPPDPTPRREGQQARHCRNDVSMRASDDARIIASPSTIRTRRQAAVKSNAPGTAGLGPIDRFAGHQRAFVKVQDGCDAFCSYCIVPYTRPRVRSRPADEIVAECRRLVAAGHREIVLCGVFLGAFGRATAVRKRWGPGPPALPELLRRVAAIDGLWRVRLSSIEPGDVTDELLAAVAELPCAAPHLHLPLQSGSPRILARMNRQYTVEQYRRTADRVRSALDRPAITTDVLVGSPGEGEEDFAATLELVRFAGFAKIHAFPFSPIEPTAGWTDRREAAPPPVVRARMAELAELERELALAYRRQFVGEVLEALVEAPRRGAPGRQAMTDRYLTVTFPAPAGAARADLTGRVVRLHVEAVTPAGLAARLAQPPADDAPAQPG